MWNLRPLPIKLEKIEFSVNAEANAFNSIALEFQGQQNFESYRYDVRNNSENSITNMEVCHVKMRKNVQTIKIKQRNTPEGVAKICGIWLVAADGTDCAKIDLCEELGSWRVQSLSKEEQIVGLHHYLQQHDDAVDEAGSVDGCESREVDWIDNIGFLVYNFEIEEKYKPPPRPVGRPRLRPLL